MAVRPGRARHRCFAGRARLPRRCRDGREAGTLESVALLGDERSGVAVPEADLAPAGGLDRPRAVLLAAAAVGALHLMLGPADLSAADVGGLAAAAGAAGAAAWLVDGGEGSSLGPGRTLTRWLVGAQAA